ncbi:hypothetical protein AC17_4749 [Escherichia coli 2-210-07_S3_C2]|nr:hypothetical protein AC17_4749 [Escherichia coli 2-210-07_S3_C2]
MTVLYIQLTRNSDLILCSTVNKDVFTVDSCRVTGKKL